MAAVTRSGPAALSAAAYLEITIEVCEIDSRPGNIDGSEPDQRKVVSCARLDMCVAEVDVGRDRIELTVISTSRATTTWCGSLAGQAALMAPATSASLMGRGIRT
jgi:hypothetical protein